MSLLFSQFLVQLLKVWCTNRNKKNSFTELGNNLDRAGFAGGSGDFLMRIIVNASLIFGFC
jgi:hypothetical protein